MKRRFSGIKVGVLVVKCLKPGCNHKKEDGCKGRSPTAINPEEHAKFVQNMFSVINS